MPRRYLRVEVQYMAQLRVGQFVLERHVHAVDRHQAFSEAVNGFHLLDVYLASSDRARFDPFEAF